MAVDHAHHRATGPGVDRTARAHRRLTWALVLVGTFFVVELVTALATGSLALLSDAGHMFTDVLGLGMALAAVHAARRGSGDRQKTFGLYRLEILAALANTVLLSGVALFIVYEAVRRFGDPPDLAATPLLVVATLGLGVNLVTFAVLRRGAAESLNVEGAYLEVLADTLGSAAVIVAAVVIATTDFTLIDPLFGLGIGLFVLPRAYRLGRRALRILLQAAPPEIDLTAVRGDLTALPGVADTHDLHVWTLTSGMDVASVHLELGEDAVGEDVLQEARSLLRTRYRITHATIQVEPATGVPCWGCDEVGE